MKKMYSIGKFAAAVGVSKQTLRHMHEDGRLIPAYISDGGTRYYSSDQLSYFKKPIAPDLSNKDLVDCLKLLKEGLAKLQPNMLEKVALEKYVVDWNKVMEEIEKLPEPTETPKVNANLSGKPYTFEDIINAVIERLSE